uniref:Phospholipase A2 hemilipin n=2 Tax=Hemiscorpius lepturus TaxID=520031 RepID=HEMI1_HEMLE|nr:RecName: Full=Phospholipase A2 hemilipin; AltName: Full=Phosphatidylcholine 2-acylhydrolase; AltName: Full=Phospholipase A(2); Contains: RecName: Full=Phospholipase A2 large subunit; Contains: RecName: Full=Phospholipase A2 small subunit; Flags: Precursor [Hemiscorpius lepturus]API81335.1 venom toxin [Hemiscorpius lepturus]
MTFLILTILATVTPSLYSHVVQRELRVNFEPLAGQRDSWPVARAAMVTFDARSEKAREFSECRMINSMHELSRELMDSPEHTVKRASKEEMDDLVQRCSGSAEGRSWFIWPDTKWCGPGTDAKNESDLGPLEADKCCRTHDHCDYIGAGETKYGLTNKSFFTKLNCKCEAAFDQCLKESIDRAEGSAKSSMEGLHSFYFNTYSPECYEVKCSRKRDAECTNGIAIWKDSYKS